MGDYTPTWVDRLQARLTVPLSWCRPLAAVTWGWGTRRWPNPFNLRITALQEQRAGDGRTALYLNGLLFVSLRLPFFINVGIRWANETRSPNTLQMHLGWRPVDGCPVAVFRVQDDKTRQGGLALGFEDGPL